MFLNINDINLGKLENDSLVYNVITPCNNNAYSFTEIMKRTFENEKLSSILNNWIDLIFGNKAKGKEAENAKNVFLEESYQESIDLKTIDIDKKIIYLKRVEFGLIPSQVMSKECPKRDKKKEVQKEKELTEYNMNNVHKIKVVQIKHDSSNDKNMKNPDGQKSKLLKADIISNDRIMMLYDNNTIIEDKIGSSNEDIAKEDPENFKKFFLQPDMLLIKGGETFAELQNRAMTTLKKIVHEVGDNKHIVIVTHGAIIRTIIAYILEMPLRKIWAIKQQNTAVNILRIDDGVFSLELLNDIHHLHI